MIFDNDDDYDDDLMHHDCDDDQIDYIPLEEGI